MVLQVSKQYIKAFNENERRYFNDALANIKAIAEANSSKAYKLNQHEKNSLYVYIKINDISLFPLSADIQFMVVYGQE